MSSRFESTFQGRVMLAAQRAFGVTVRFVRGVNVSAEFTARRADREYETIGAEYGIEIKITMRDFTVQVSSVVIDGDSIEPRTGDRIMEGEEMFQIQPVSEGKPSVELQAGGYEWICHTKKVE